MTGKLIDLATWPRAAQFRFFRAYERPQYAVTARPDVTRLLARRQALSLSPYRACIWAIGAGLHAVPELLTRFRGDEVTAHDRVDVSMTVPADDGTFRYCYVPWQTDRKAFDSDCAARIEAARNGALNANSGQRDDVAYLSCMPWLDYTAINNALPGPDDCIPRVSWGKFTEDSPGCWRMAMTIEVHHALVDGLHVGQFFAATQRALDTI